MGNKEWLLYVVIAGLAWGTYVPLIAFGGKALGGNRFAALLCVGVAYVLIAVLFPLVMFLTKQADWPAMKPTGLIFASAAGAAGAIGALMVIYAAKAAGQGSESAFYIAPLIFGLAPIINTVVSMIWHPKVGSPFDFHLELPPGWKLWVGIILVGLGAALVLFSKEELEAANRPQAPPATNPAPDATTPNP